jgi:predicted dehydrogenase
LEKVRVGIIGSQFAAGLHAAAYTRTPYVEILAASAIDNLEKFSSEFNIPDTYQDYHQMLEREDIDLISVCVPNFLHKEMVLAAARAGKHIVCEKPLATKIEDARAMVDAAKKAGVKLMYAEDWVFAPALVRTKSLIGEGAIGDVLYIKAREAHPGSHSIYAQSKEYCGGGAMIHLAIHPIGFVRWLKEKEVVEVLGKTSAGASGNLVHKNYGGEDWAMGILTFEDGTFAEVEGNYITLGGLDDRVEIYGREGNIKVDLSQGSPLSVYSRVGFSYAVEKADTTKGWTRPAVDEEAALGYVDEIAYFVECVREDKEVKWGVRGEDGEAALEIALAVYESQKTRKAVKLTK